MRQDVLEEAQKLWNTGQLLEVGHILCNNIPRGEQPTWAASILDAVYGQVRAIPEVDVVLDIARCPQRWHEGHKAFDSVRDITVRIKDGDPLQEGILILAENVAKVAYNATGPRDHFDTDTAAWLIPNFKYVIDHVDDPALASRAWSILSRNK